MSGIQSDRRLFLGLLAALSVNGPMIRKLAAADDDPKPDPKALARKVEALYSKCKSYRDTGKVTQVAYDAQGKESNLGRTKPCTVTTAYVRPDQLRFEFDDERRGKLIRHLIWMEGAVVKTWWDIRPGVEKSESLHSALGAAVGVTQSASMTIAPLLLPDRFNHGKPLSEGPGELSQLDDEPIGAHACHRLRQRFQAVNFQNQKKFDVIVTYWIDTQTSAIRRTVREMNLEEGRFVGTLELEPEFDVDLAEPALAFDPPEAAASPPRSPQ